MDVKWLRLLKNPLSMKRASNKSFRNAFLINPMDKPNSNAIYIVIVPIVDLVAKPKWCLLRYNNIACMFSQDIGFWNKATACHDLINLYSKYSQLRLWQFIWSDLYCGNVLQWSHACAYPGLLFRQTVTLFRGFDVWWE